MFLSSMRFYMLKLLKFLTLTICLSIPQVNADAGDELNKLKSNFENCTEQFDKREKNCPKKWSYRCYNILMDAHKETQQCYIDVAKDLFLLYYNQEHTQTQKMFNEIADFTYKNHLYIYQESEYCKKNNCGISAYLRSQYATTHAIKDYINKTIIAVQDNQ